MNYSELFDYSICLESRLSHESCLSCCSLLVLKTEIRKASDIPADVWGPGEFGGVVSMPWRWEMLSMVWRAVCGVASCVTQNRPGSVFPGSPGNVGDVTSADPGQGSNTGILLPSQPLPFSAISS